MREHHYLGFKQFAGRGMRYVAEYKGQWLAIAAWQAGAFMCAPRDRWIKWKKECQFKNLHLIGNNTRFLILGEAGEFPNLASYFLCAMTRRLSEDWMERYGHGLLLAESFVDPRHFGGAMYKASNWKFAGLSRGYAVPTAATKSPMVTGRNFMSVRCAKMPGACFATPIPWEMSGRPKERVRGVRTRSFLRFTRRWAIFLIIAEPRGESTRCSVFWPSIFSPLCPATPELMPQRSLQRIFHRRNLRCSGLGTTGRNEGMKLLPIPRCTG